MVNWRGRLGEAVKRSGKPHKAIAYEAGLTPTTLSRILHGGHKRPYFETIVRIAHAVEESVGWISGDKAFSLSAQERKRLQAATVILSEITRRG
jgi:transcriptional regulator with XRE-family HTH domain